MNLKPLGDRVVVRPLDEEETMKSDSTFRTQPRKSQSKVK